MRVRVTVATRSGDLTAPLLLSVCAALCSRCRCAVDRDTKMPPSRVLRAIDDHCSCGADFTVAPSAVPLPSDLASSTSCIPPPIRLVMSARSPAQMFCARVVASVIDPTWPSPSCYSSQLIMRRRPVALSARRRPLLPSSRPKLSFLLSPCLSLPPLFSFPLSHPPVPVPRFPAPTVILIDLRLASRFRPSS